MPNAANAPTQKAARLISSVRHRRSIMNVTWLKTNNGGWHNLTSVDLAHSHFNDLKGIYIIWQRYVSTANVVKVGQGVIRDRLQLHRNDEKIQAYNAEGLSVTWAQVNTLQCDSVERFLGDIYSPKVAQRFPDVVPLNVNLPRNE